MSILNFSKKISSRSEKKPKQEAAAKPSGKKKTDVGKLHLAGTIGLAPVITEKGMLVQALANTVVFRVAREASKQMIIKAVAEKYGVTPKDVRVLVQKPKTRRRGRTVGMTSSWKKAYVTLPEGKNIDISAV